MDIITLNIPQDKLKVIKRLLDIAEKPHKINCSPVHIIEELKDIEYKDIIELKHKISELTS